MNNTAKLVMAFVRCSGLTDAREISAATDVPVATIYRALKDIKLSILTGGNDNIPTHEKIPVRENENIPTDENPRASVHAQELFEEINTPIPPQKPEPLPIDEALELWQQLAAEKGLPRVERFTKERKQKLSARLREVGLEGWEKAINAIRGSKFHCGQNDRNWRATFDFVVRSENKVAELIERGNANGHRKPTPEQLKGMTQGEVIRLLGRAH